MRKILIQKEKSSKEKRLLYIIRYNFLRKVFSLCDEIYFLKKVCKLFFKVM